MVKLGADILLQLRQITLPLVELQFFLDMKLLGNLYIDDQSTQFLGQEQTSKCSCN